MTPEELEALRKTLRDALKIIDEISFVRSTISAASWCENWSGRGVWMVFGTQGSDGAIAVNFCRPDPMPPEHWVDFKHNRNDRKLLSSE